MLLLGFHVITSYSIHYTKLYEGPEPEDVKVATINGETYAYVGLERIGGVMAFNITDPANVYFENYINTRQFSTEDPDAETGYVDVSVEGLCVVPAIDSPINKDLLLAANEVSGTVAVYKVVDAESTQVNILFTNDSHSRVVAGSGIIGMDKIAKVDNNLQNSVLVDIGDTLHGLPVANINNGENIITLMNQAGYDVMTPGNHDFNYGSDRLLELAAMANFDIISSNITKKSNNSNYLDTISVQTIRNNFV